MEISIFVLYLIIPDFHFQNAAFKGSFVKGCLTGKIEGVGGSACQKDWSSSHLHLLPLSLSEAWHHWPPVHLNNL